MFSFSANDFLACNGTRIGAEHLHGRMQGLRELIEPALTERHPDLTAVVSPIYASVGFRPNPNRPRDHACLYFVDRALKKSRFPRLPQLGVYLHHNSLAIGFYSGWWTSEAMRVAIADRGKFRGLVPRKGYRCFAGDIIVESPGRSVLWSPSKLAGVDRSLFVGRILTAEEAACPSLVDDVQAAFADLYALYAVFTEARAHAAEPRVEYVPDPAEEGVVKDALAPAEAELLCDLHRFIALKNFHIDPGMLFNLYLCLKTKPFLILAGSPEPGKARSFASSPKPSMASTMGAPKGIASSPCARIGMRCAICSGLKICSRARFAQVPCSRPCAKHEPIRGAPISRVWTK